MCFDSITSMQLCLCPWDSMFSMVSVISGLWEMAPCISLCSPPSHTLHILCSFNWVIIWFITEARVFSLAVSNLQPSQCTSESSSVFGRMRHSFLRRVILKMLVWPKTVVLMTRDTWAGGLKKSSSLCLVCFCLIFVAKGAAPHTTMWVLHFC